MLHRQVGYILTVGSSLINTANKLAVRNIMLVKRIFYDFKDLRRCVGLAGGRIDPIDESFTICELF